MSDLTSSNLIYAFSFALTESGHIFELCPYTGLANPIESPEQVDDFIITGTEDSGIEILALTRNPVDSTFLKVYDFSSKF